MEYTDDMKKRLKRIEGQARGVIRMMDENKNCEDVIHQLSAIRSAVEKLSVYIVGSNMEYCIKDSLKKGENTEEVIADALKLLAKTR